MEVERESDGVGEGERAMEVNSEPAELELKLNERSMKKKPTVSHAGCTSAAR